MNGIYSGTLPYGHPTFMATLLSRPLHSGLNKAWSIILLCREPLQYGHPVNNMARFLWPTGDWINRVLQEYIEESSHEYPKVLYIVHLHCVYLLF